MSGSRYRLLRFLRGALGYRVRIAVRDQGETSITPRQPGSIESQPPVALRAGEARARLTVLSPASQARCGDSPAFVGVVIPANDESGSVAASVAAVRRAASHPALERSLVAVVVIDDSSSDTTADRAAAALGGSGAVIRVEARSAGVARRAGFLELCRSSRGLDADGVWFATTDADTLVHPDWLARQLGWWRRGAAGVAGLVRPLSWEEQPAVVRRRYAARMARLGLGLGHPHVYAANLGLTKAAYLDAGGVAPIDSGEDHALWNALVLTGRRPVHAPDVLVSTSTRREGRAPDGFSALLRSLEDDE